MSSSSLDEVSTTTGINFVLGSERSCFNTSRPLNFGSFRSRRMTAGMRSRLRPAYWPLPKTNSSASFPSRSEEHTSELQSRLHLVCRLLLEKKKKKDEWYVIHISDA